MMTLALQPHYDDDNDDNILATGTPTGNDGVRFCNVFCSPNGIWTDWQVHATLKDAFGFIAAQYGYDGAFVYGQTATSDGDERLEEVL